MAKYIFILNEPERKQYMICLKPFGNDTQADAHANEYYSWCDCKPYRATITPKGEQTLKALQERVLNDDLFKKYRGHMYDELNDRRITLDTWKDELAFCIDYSKTLNMAIFRKRMERILCEFGDIVSAVHYNGHTITFMARNSEWPNWDKKFYRQTKYIDE